MTWTLNVYITGLCIFVPVKDKNGIIKETRVLFANAHGENRIKKVLGSGQQPPLLENHKPLVQFAVRNRVSDVPNYPLFQDADGHLNGLWLLDKEDLRIRIDHSPDLKMTTERLDGKSAGGAETFPIPGTDDEDFYWVTPMRDANKDLIAVKPGLMDDPASDPGEDMTARMIIDAGTLKPAAFSGNETRGELFLFDLGMGDQAMATMVKLEIPNIPEGNSVLLEASDYGDRMGTSRQLELVPFGQEPEVEIFVLNREFEEVHSQAVPIEALNDGPRRHEQEYKFLEAMLKKPPRRNIRHPQPKPVPNYPKSARCANPAMRRIYFPGQGGEGGLAGGPCNPGTAKA